MGIVEKFYQRKIAQTVLTLYHGTWGDSVDKILETGLLMPRMETGAAAVDVELPSREECVYVTKDFAEAEHMLNMRSSSPGAVFEVKATPAELYLDEDVVWDAAQQAFLHRSDFRNHFFRYILNLEGFANLKRSIQEQKRLNYIELNDEIKQLTRWIEDNDPVMKAVLILNTRTTRYCLKHQVPIEDVHYIDPYVDVDPEDIDPYMDEYPEDSDYMEEDESLDDERAYEKI